MREMETKGKLAVITSLGDADDDCARANARLLRQHSFTFLLSVGKAALAKERKGRGSVLPDRRDRFHAPFSPFPARRFNRHGSPSNNGAGHFRGRVNILFATLFRIINKRKFDWRRA